MSLRQQRKSLFDALLYKKHPSLYRLGSDRGPRCTTTPCWALLGLAVAAAGLGLPRVFLLAACGWMAACGHFCARRLRGTSRAPSHVAEMIVTSMLIPPLSVFWRLYGAEVPRTFRININDL